MPRVVAADPSLAVRALNLAPELSATLCESLALEAPIRSNHEPVR